MEDFNVTVLGNEMINKNGLFIEKEIIHSYHAGVGKSTTILTKASSQKKRII